MLNGNTAVAPPIDIVDDPTNQIEINDDPIEFDDVKADLIKCVQRSIITPENMIGIKVFMDNVKVVNSILQKMDKELKKIESLTKTEVAKKLGIPTNKMEIVKQELFADESAKAYFLTKLLEEPNVTKLHKTNVTSNGKDINKACADPFIIDIKGKSKRCIDKTCLVDVGEFKYGVFPATRNYREPKSNKRIFIYVHKEKTEQALDNLKEMANKLDPMHNEVVTVGSGFSIEDFKYQFDMDHVVLSNDIKQECDLIQSLFRDNEKFKKQNIPTKRGVLLSGIPGVGKTTTTNALIAKVLDAGGTIFRYVPTHRSSSCGGLTEPSILFKYAAKHKPALIVLEDFDLVAANRTPTNQFMPTVGGTATVTSELLDVLEHKEEDIIVIATTNQPEILDDAAIRSGRIDKIHCFSYPNLEMKKKIIEIHRQHYNIDIDPIESMQHILNEDITGAMIASILLSARQKAISEDRKVNSDDIKWASSQIKINRVKDAIL